MGVSAKSRTVFVMSSSGRDVTSEERRNHWRPAARGRRGRRRVSQHPCHDGGEGREGKEGGRTFASEDLCDAVLLVQETLLIDLVQKTALAVPARDRLEELEALLLRADVAHLDHDERVLVRGPGGEEHVRVELAWGAFDAVAEVLDERGCCCAVEAAVGASVSTAAEEKPGQRCEEGRGSDTEGMDALDEVAGEDDGDGKRACLVAGRDAERGSCATHGPP